jgi:hypothetical protein
LSSRSARPYPTNPLRSSSRSATVVRGRLDSSRNDPSRSRRSAPPPSIPRADRDRFERQACSAQRTGEEPDTLKAFRAPSRMERREWCSLRHPVALRRSLEPHQNLSSCSAYAFCLDMLGHIFGESPSRHLDVAQYGIPLSGIPRSRNLRNGRTIQFQKSGIPRNRRFGAWQVETNPLVRDTDYTPTELIL